MNILEATSLAIQGKLVEGLSLEVTKWTSDEIKEKYIAQIAETNKPIKYTKIGGFDRAGVAVYETEEISLEKLKELFTYFEGYFVTEHDNYIKVTRVDRI